MKIDSINFYNTKFKSFFVLLFLLTPIVIFFSKFLSDLFLTIIAIYTLVFLIKFKKFNYIKNLKYFFIIILYFSINLIINNFDIVLLLKSLSLFRFPLFILFSLIIFDDLEILKKKLYLFFIPLLIFLLNLYIQAFFNFDLFGNIVTSDYQRITSFFGDEYIAGSYLFFIFSIIILITNKFNNTILILLSIIYFGIFLSGDRTPFIMVNLYLILICLINIKKIFFTKKFITIFFLIPTIFFSILFLDINKLVNISAFDKYKGTYKNIINDIKQKDNDENNLGLKRWPYYGLYSKSLVIFKNNIFFGTTYKSFRHECGKKKYDEDYSKLTNGLEYVGCSTHPHNIYLEVLSEQGLFGFFLLILLIYNFFNLPNVLFLSNSIKYYVFLIIYFFPFKPFGSIYTNFNLIMLSAIVALFIIFNKKKINPSNI